MSDLNIETLNYDFNMGLVPYEADLLYVYTDEDGTKWYSQDSDQLISNFGCNNSELRYGYFFPLTKKD